MAKYNLTFELKVVTAYLNGEGRYEYLTKKYGSNAFVERGKGRTPTMSRTDERAARTISSLRREFKLNEILAALRFQKATYMYWQQCFDRVNPDIQIRIAIQDIRKEHPHYGYRRLLLLLQSRGIVINKKRLQRIMQKFNLQVIAFSRKSRKYNSYKGVKGRIAPNRIKRRFHCSQPHQKITTDTTEFKYYELDANGALKVRKLYLDPFMDLYNLEIISFSTSPTPSAESILSAQQQAIENYIIYYNTKRIKEKLNWLSPVDYRLATTAA